MLLLTKQSKNLIFKASWQIKHTAIYCNIHLVVAADLYTPRVFHDHKKIDFVLLGGGRYKY